MIPNRIFLKGFLSYREPVEFDFQGEPLWMLTGPNGSGKSAIFDAMTYALFGTHRLGSHNADELIHKEAEALEVVFEFEHAGTQYRIRRALRRAKNPRPAQQAFRRQDDAQEWEPLEETEGVKELKQWVEKGLGLRYETFTTSVLLLQGKAENLIAAEPRDRRAVLHGVVDMQRYVRLHELIELRRKSHRADRDAQEKLLRGQPEVSDAQLAAARQELEGLDDERQRLSAELQRRQRLEMQAERWPELRRQADEVRQRLEQAERILFEAEAIESGWQRWQSLRALLPKLEAAAQAWQRRDTQRRALDELIVQESRGAKEQSQQEQQCAAARADLDAQQRQAQEQRVRLQALDAALAQQALTLQRLEHLAGRRQELATIEAKIARLPRDLARQLEGTERYLAELAELRVALPSLETLHEEHTSANQVAQKERELAAAEPSLVDALAQAEAALVQVDAALAQAEQDAQTAQDELTRARTRGEETEQRWHRFEALAGRPSCGVCGQPLTEQHMQEERQRLATERAQRREVLTRAKAASTSVRAALSECRGTRQAWQKDTERARLQLGDHQRTRAAAREALQRCEQACARARERLPESFRSRDLPTAAELVELRERAGSLPALQKKAAALRRQHAEFRMLQQHRTAMLDALRGEPECTPEEIARLRGEHEQRRTERQQAGVVLQRCEDELVQTRQRREALEQAGTKLAARLATVRGARREAERQWQEIDTAWQQRCAELTPDWRAAIESGDAERLSGARTELAVLERAQIAERYQALQLIRRQQADWQGHADHLDTEMSAIPVEARRPLEQLRTERDAAETEQAQCDQRHREAERQLSRLLEQRQRRDATLAELQQADHQFHLCDRLAALLGPRGLQLHLLREAERGIVEMANEALERLSGGELTLELARTEEGDPTENPLQLQVRCRSVGPHPLHVAQLSGSQKFRVAVSLALAIGQYASRQPRTLEAVIIDEGFGCLDRAGRQVMIQELHQLKDQLRRIILVSHQEEFAETFPAGYQLTLEEGSTRARRM
jgi:DNA repair exonuclease SbcCD ATPase subunit